MKLKLILGFALIECNEDCLDYSKYPKYHQAYTGYSYFTMNSIYEYLSNICDSRLMPVNYKQELLISLPSAKRFFNVLSKSFVPFTAFSSYPTPVF